MPSFYNLMNEASRKRWAKKARELKGFWEPPETPDYRPKVEGKIEDTDEIGYLMSRTPWQDKEEK